MLILPHAVIHPGLEPRIRFAPVPDRPGLSVPRCAHRTIIELPGRDGDVILSAGNDCTPQETADWLRRVGYQVQMAMHAAGLDSGWQTQPADPPVTEPWRVA